MRNNLWECNSTLQRRFQASGPIFSRTSRIFRLKKNCFKKRFFIFTYKLQSRCKTALSAQTGVSGVTYLGRGLRSDGGAITLLGAGAVVVAWTLWRVTTFLWRGGVREGETYSPTQFAYYCAQWGARAQGKSPWIWRKSTLNPENFLVDCKSRRVF